jgi:hypothetical protein
VVLSQSRMGAFHSMARERDTRCFSPPDSFKPHSPTSIVPVGKFHDDVLQVFLLGNFHDLIQESIEISVMNVEDNVLGDDCNGFSYGFGCAVGNIPPSYVYRSTVRLLKSKEHSNKGRFATTR